MRERESGTGCLGRKKLAAANCCGGMSYLTDKRTELQSSTYILHQTPTYTPYDLVASYNFIESIVDVNVQVILSYILYLDYNTLYLTRSIIYSFYR